MDLDKKSLKTLEFDKIKEKLAGYTRVKQSKELCLSLDVFSDISYIKNQLKLTSEAKKLLDSAMELPIEYVADVKNIAQTISLYLNEQEIVDIGKTLRSSRLVKNFLRENTPEDSLLNGLSYNLFVDKDFEDRIFDTFDSNLNVQQDATPELKSLYNSLRDSERNLKTRVNDLLNNPDFSKYLQEQIYTTRDDRVVFQVKASFKSRVDGIVHDVSATSQTFYIEPAQIVPLNNKIRELQSQIHTEIVRILTDLTLTIKRNLNALIETEGLLAQIDFHFAKARYAVKLRAIEPEIIQEKYIKIDAMKHPILLDYTENVVANDFEIGRDYKSVIITGSNTGGKTVAIKTIGLFILMTKAGLFLPCLNAKIYPYKHVFADIGDEQSLEQNLSTFSSHMKNIIEIVNQSDEETFVLMDEICAGTDPQEGSILAEVILERLAQNNVTSCVTTHYGELKSLEYSNSYFKNACVEFDVKSLKPTYKLIIGIPGLSNAIAISSNIGLDKDLVDKAKELLISQKDPSIIVVEKLQEKQHELEENLEITQNAKEEALSIKKDYEEKLERVKKDKKKVVKTTKSTLDSELDRAKDEIKDILYEMRHEKSEKIARRSYSRLAKLEHRARNEINKLDESQKYEDILWEEIKAGDEVMLKDLNQPVTVLSMPDKSGNVFVQMGLIKTKINKNKLVCYEEKYAPKKQLSFTPKEKFEIERHDMSNTLDLRGFRVEEALDSVEVFLDKASLLNLTPVYIIHGHGTGALKSAVREFLSSSPYVAKFRPGEVEEGGDGVSVIDIN